MKNPYDEIDAHPSDVTFSGKALWAVAILFGLGIVSVPVCRHFGEYFKPKEERWFPIVEFFKHPNQKSFNHLFGKKSKSSLVTRETPNLRDHLQSFESGIKDSSLRKSIQQGEQSILSAIYSKGNQKVVVGNDGWLFYRPAIEAITGYGPLKAEPDSVTKDPDRPQWNDPLLVIERFAKQLKERDVELMIVPIPVKPMIQPEHLGIEDSFVVHPDQNQLYERLRAMDIEVVDLLPTFKELKLKNSELFLRQDTHWRAEVAKATAKTVANRIKQRDWYRSAKKSSPAKLEITERSGLGDLVGMLGLPEGNNRYEEEIQTIERVLDPETGRALDGNLISPISILGDSFINIYEEPGLGFGTPLDEGLIGAGFGSHLSAFLNLRPHVIAINGEGATGVRQGFAALPDNVVRAKKMVVWAIASRDFLLSETAANRAGVFWKEVQFNPEEDTSIGQPPPQPGDENLMILSGILKQKSIITDPSKTPYEDATYSTIFGDLEISSGEYHESEIIVSFWAFRKRQLEPTAKLEIGKRYQLKLAPLISKPEISRKTQLNDFGDRFELDSMFAVEIEPN